MFNINFQLKYTDVSVAKYESHKPNLIHNAVNYSIIDVRVCPEGNEVNSYLEYYMKIFLYNSILFTLLCCL